MFGVLLRFREGPFAVHAIVEERTSDSDLQDLPLDPRMNHLDPASATDREQIFKLLRQSLEKVSVTTPPPKVTKEKTKKKKGPVGKDPAERQYHNEEYFDSYRTLEEAKRTVGKVVKYHRQGGYICGNFVTNSVAVKKAVANVQPLDQMIQTAPTRWINESDGHAGNQVDVFWDTKKDFLDHRIRYKKFEFGELPSRREVLELVSKLDDPLGLMSNTTNNLRALLQEMQNSPTPWDGQIFGRPKAMWNTWLAKVAIAGYSTIPRSLTKGGETRHQLHAYVGAFTRAIATCIYLRSSSHQDPHQISVGLAAAEAKVTPLRNPQPVLQLEFKAAYLGAQLARKVQEETRFKLEETILWTDSQAVLDAIRTYPQGLAANAMTTAVKSLVGRIRQLTKANQWRLIPPGDNPTHAATAV